MPTNDETHPWPQTVPLLTLVGVGAALLWAYWPVGELLVDKWSTDPQFSFGFLVAPFALFLLWSWRGSLSLPLAPASPWGLLLLILGGALRLAGARFYFEWAESISLLLCLAGLLLLTGGGPLLRWGWPAVAFLFFMIPPPHRVEHALTGTLQRTAASSCAAVLLALDRPAHLEGNRLILGDKEIEVVAACSGLGSLFVFFAMSVGVALLSGRPWLDRCVLVASAVPIALGTNTLRIVATVLLQELAGDAASFDTIHEWTGWLMMGVALAALWAELALLRALFVESPGTPEKP